MYEGFANTILALFKKIRSNYQIDIKMYIINATNLLFYVFGIMFPKWLPNYSLKVTYSSSLRGEVAGFKLKNNVEHKGI